MNIEQKHTDIEQLTGHVPVMLEEVLETLQPRKSGRYIDGTFGGGGHSAAILARSAPDGKVLGIDVDVQALARARERFPLELQAGRLLLVQDNFAEMSRIVTEVHFEPVNGILLDLGFSSYQMDDPQRGFSFSADGPLDMRLDPSLPVSASDIVNESSEEQLADIFRRYGEEPRARQIARRIVRERARGAISRTAQLAAIAAAGVPYRPGSIHPATRVFQALRIEVNRELERLAETLPQMLDILKTYRATGAGGEEAGRMVVISFHSLEDRIVKAFMRREAADCLCPPRTPVCICGHKAQLRILTPKPVTPSDEEIRRNPRARSAKLRAAEVVVHS